jgi:hypothetical protein
MNMPLEDYWDKPHPITPRQLATALEAWDEGDTRTVWLEAVPHIIAAIPETAAEECPAIILLDSAHCDLTPGHEGDHMFAGHPFEPFDDD